MCDLTDADLEEGYFILVKEANAYNPNRFANYFWSGPYLELKDANAYKARRAKRCQSFYEGVVTCKRIKGWKAFLKAAEKVGIHPKRPVEFLGY